jgi:PRTRC genetic system protein B
MDDYKPVLAIVAYSNDGVYYLEERKVSKENGKVELLEGKPLTKKTYTAIAESIKSSTEINFKSRGFISDKVISFSKSLSGIDIVWKWKSRKQLLKFDKKLKIKSTAYMLPDLIFKLHNNTLSVFSYKRYQKEKTLLYKAPFHNINSGGSICMGNAKGDSEQIYIEDIMDSWENAFFMSEFTHFNDSEVSTKRLTEILKEMKTAKAYPMEYLVKTNKHLKQIL